MNNPTKPEQNFDSGIFLKKEEYEVMLKKFTTAVAAIAILSGCSIGKQVISKEKVNVRKLQFLNIVPMLPQYKDSYIADTVDLYRKGAVTESAFIISLVPEGDPVEKKAEVLGKRFLDFRAAVKQQVNMPVGILLQSSIGHGWIPGNQANFQRMVRPDGHVPYQFCPLDPKFQEYIKASVEYLATLKPDFFMLDDDVRMLTGRNGCFCPLHLKEYQRRTGKNMTFESMVKAVHDSPETAAEYDAMMRDVLADYCRIIRKAIDTVSPETNCSYCSCAEDIRHAGKMAEILAAPDTKPTLRINNARYMQESLRSLPEWLLKTYRQISAYPEDWNILCEPDTFSHNRFFTSSRMMHNVLTHSILEGCVGGKFWIRRTGTPEFKSGEFYKQTLIKYSRFYQELANMKIRWQGVATAVPRPVMNFPASEKTAQLNLTWTTHLLGKMGFPVYFDKLPEGVTAISGNESFTFTDDDLRKLLQSKGLLLDGVAALDFCKRGFAAEIGVNARQWNGKKPSLELQAQTLPIPLSGAWQYTELLPEKGTDIISEIHHKPEANGTKTEYLMPGVTWFTNRAGCHVAVFAGPILPISSISAGWHNETRQKQLTGLLNRMDTLPCYVPDSCDLLLKTGICGDYRILLLNNLSLDDLPEVELSGLKSAPSSVELLQPDGSWNSVPAEWKNGSLKISVELRPLDPLIFRLK